MQCTIINLVKFLLWWSVVNLRSLKPALFPAKSSSLYSLTTATKRRWTSGSVWCSYKESLETLVVTLRLRGITSVLNQAGSYAQQNMITFFDYLNIYEAMRQRADLEPIMNRDNSWGHCVLRMRLTGTTLCCWVLHLVFTLTEILLK